MWSVKKNTPFLRFPPEENVRQIDFDWGWRRSRRSLFLSLFLFFFWDFSSPGSFSSNLLKIHYFTQHWSPPGTRYLISNHARQILFFSTRYYSTILLVKRNLLFHLNALLVICFNICIISQVEYPSFCLNNLHINVCFNIYAPYISKVKKTLLFLL